MDEIYVAWKPIRNFLKRVDPKIALEVIRYYSLFSGTPGEIPPTPPSCIEVNKAILNRDIIGIFPWDMEILAREIVLSSENNLNDYRYDLRQWRDFANLMHKLRFLENKISKVGIDSKNVLLEMFRIGHRQFPHQQDIISKDSIVRYGRLFTRPEVAPIVLDRTNLTYEKIITIGIVFWGLFKSFSAIEHPMQGFKNTNISKDDVENFLILFSKSFQEIKELIADEHLIDNTFMYQYSSLNAYPLVRFERSHKITYICSSVNRYSSQITRGVYYMLFSDIRFDNAFGNAFEDYVGNLLKETANGGDSYAVYSQEIDNADRKRRCDWIIDQKDSFVMVECKTKRMAIDGYTILDDEAALIKQLGILADAVVQTYQGYLIYKGEGYKPPIYPFAKIKKGSLCIVTLEKWYLYGEPLEKLQQIVIDKLKAKNIDTNIIKEAPYEVMGVDDFEKMTFLAKQGESIREVFKHHASGDEYSHEFSVFMNEHFKDKLKSYNYVFSSDLDLYITSGQ